MLSLGLYAPVRRPYGAFDGQESQKQVALRECGKFRSLDYVTFLRNASSTLRPLSTELDLVAARASTQICMRHCVSMGYTLEIAFGAFKSQNSASWTSALPRTPFPQSPLKSLFINLVNLACLRLVSFRSDA